MANNLNQAFIQNNQDNLVEDAPNNVTLVANEVRQIPNNNSVNAEMSMAVDVAPHPFNNVSTIAPNNTMYNVASNYNYNNNNMSLIAPNNNRNSNFINMGGARRSARRSARRRTRRHRVKVRKTHRRQSRMRHRR
jgi:hypothetical protein